VASISILSINANAGLDVTRRRYVLPALRDAIHAVDADIVCVQEVLGEQALHAQRHPGSPRIAHHEYLAGTRWPHSAYGCNAVFADGNQGNALLSKFKFTESHNHDVSIGSHEPRGLLHGVVRLPQRRHLHVINVHLGLLESHRQQQVELLCRFIESEIPDEAPLIVAGDFNDWRKCIHAALRNAGLREVFEEATGSLARTFPARLPLLPLDRIYLRNATACNVDVLSLHPWSHLSDHAALYAQIELAG
jgi:endonuclease/exonuclease/phosphatase family metal-dependent hydrolase